MSQYDSLYVKFIYYFNVTEDFYECHEVMEELWLDEGRYPLYQGLLQAAVALHHFSYGNKSGAKKLFRGGLEKMQPYLHQHEAEQLGIDLEQFCSRCAQFLHRLEQDPQVPFEFETFKITIIDPVLQKRVAECGHHSGNE